MGLDDLLSSYEDDDRPAGRATAGSAARDRRRTHLLAGAAVAAAVGLGVGVGLLAATLGDDDPRARATAPGATPTPAAPSVVPPSSSRPATTSSPAPAPSATSDVPASRTDTGFITATRATRADGAALQLSFDRVQLLTGQAAEREAAERGEQAESGYYLVNESRRLRTLLVADGATVTGDSSFNSWAGDGGGGQRPRTLEELARFVRTEAGRETVFDLRYDARGRVTAIAERYLP